MRHGPLQPVAVSPFLAQTARLRRHPVDNELQTLVPNLLRFILDWLWTERFDWFFGVNMGIYSPNAPNPRVAPLCLMPSYA
ncbi:MAG: hypothetical protein JO235_02115 [Chroococcidiopsidaceae cyanobacterium CP_BM_RX_35]|nr:hypothetical protein [Chroococcidiopsidaceae cyanobacterium CP_BM_RX_35]